MALRTKGRAKHQDDHDDTTPLHTGTSFRFQGPVPERFDFKSDEWLRWLKRFERYRMSSGLFKEPDSVQVNCLMGLLGDEGEDVLLSFNIPEESMAYDFLIESFSKYFEKKKLM